MCKWWGCFGNTSGHEPVLLIRNALRCQGRMLVTPVAPAQPFLGCPPAALWCCPTCERRGGFVPLTAARCWAKSGHCGLWRGCAHSQGSACRCSVNFFRKNTGKKKKSSAQLWEMISMGRSRHGVSAEWAGWISASRASSTSSSEQEHSCGCQLRAPGALRGARVPLCCTETAGGISRQRMSAAIIYKLEMLWR